jgi:hypothetical protein
MQQYKWPITELEEKLKKLYILRKKETNFQKLEMIDEDIRTLESLLHKKNKIGFDGLIKKYHVLRSYYPGYEFLIPKLNEFNAITSEFSLKEKRKILTLTDDELLSLTHDFYKNTNNYLFGNFIDVFQKRKDHIEFDESANNYVHGVTYPIHTSKDAFIKIYKWNTIEDLIAIIHEYMHAISASINPNHLYEKKYLYTEVDTLFIEMLVRDFIKEVFNEEMSINEKVIAHEKIKEEASILCSLIRLIEMEMNKKTKYITSEQLRKNALKAGLTDQSIDDVLHNPNRYNETYIIGYSLAVELYEIYKQDKDKAFDILKRFILLKNYYSQEMHSIIEELGLHPNTHLEEFQKNIEEEYRRVRKNDLII